MKEKQKRKENFQTPYKYILNNKLLIKISSYKKRKIDNWREVKEGTALLSNRQTCHFMTNQH